MRLNDKRQLLGIIVVLFVFGFDAEAETLSGTVIDPQKRIIAGARVSLTCEGETTTQKSDGRGHFSFVRETFPENCTIRAEYPSFAPQETTLGHSRTFTLELRLAGLKQSTVVEGGVLSTRPLVSVSLSSEQLREISNQTSDLVNYAKNLAGIYSGIDRVYVDGLPTNSLPPAETVERIVINGDPFSAEYSDGFDTHIDILTKKPSRKFHVSVAAAPLGTSAHSVLNSRLTTSSRDASASLTGPVPHLPLSFTMSTNFAYRRSEEPIQAAVPPLQDRPSVYGAEAPTRNFNGTVVVGAYYSTKESLRVNASLYASMGKESNINLSGLTLPEGGIGERSTALEFRATLAKTGRGYLYRGGFSSSWSNAGLRANSSSLGVSVSGAFSAGGADIYRESTQGTRWTLKNVLQFSTPNRNWSVGGTVSRQGSQQSETPNPSGHITFANVQDYIMSATAGAHSGTGLMTRGHGEVRYASYTAAPFVETELLRREGVSVRGGLRADYQTAGSALLSPRISAVAALHGVVLRAGSGMFVQNWANDIFLRVMENDGSHFYQVLIRNASLSDVQSGAVTLGSNIVSRIAPDLAPARDWVSRFSVEHPFRSFVPGVEYTLTEGTHLLGSQRLSTPTGWADVLQSNRAVHKQQLHFRALGKVRGQTLTAHYEWAHARDNTDGPFSFPARQGDLRGEWAPASGTPGRNLTLVGNARLGKATSLALVETWHSGAPLNITSGVDAEGNGLFTDRGGRTRNSWRGPSYNSTELFAHRRIPIRNLLSHSRHKMYVNLTVQVLNLLGNKNSVSIGTVFGSALLGRSLAALPGRSVRLWLNLGQ